MIHPDAPKVAGRFIGRVEA